MATTEVDYHKVIDQCRALFVNKMKDYGSAWRILRTSSLTDQIYIKAQRIRSLQLKKVKNKGALTLLTPSQLCHFRNKKNI